MPSSNDEIVLTRHRQCRGHRHRSSPWMGRILEISSLFVLTSSWSRQGVSDVVHAFSPYASSSSSPTIQHSRSLPSRSSIRMVDSISSSQQPVDTVSSFAEPDDTLETKTFGNVRRIRMPGEEEPDENEDDHTSSTSSTSFVGVVGVPTFATIADETRNSSPRDDDHHYQAPTNKRGLEGALGHDHGPAFVVDNVLSSKLCNDIIDDCEHSLGGFGQFDVGRNHHGAMQILVSQSTADDIAQRLAPHINVDEVDKFRRKMIQDEKSLYQQQQSQQNSDEVVSERNEDEDEDDVRIFFAGLNRRWRIYRYHPSGNETFAPHIDASFPPSGLTDDGRSLIWDDSSNDQTVVSRLTVLMYLSDDFVGGATNFYMPLVEDEKIPGPSAGRPLPMLASVKPVTGSVLLFPQGVGENAVEYARRHWPLHEGSAVLAGPSPKYVIRSDALFVEERETPPFDDDNKSLFQYDNLVRKTFLLKSRIWDSSFLSHANLLFNPHMGVENLGPLLYSFIRFTKVKRVCEIGAGYTSIWILQAMKDNDDEMQQIQSLQSNGQCRMLDIDWTIHSKVNEFHSEPARLFCIDNCEHQKETATGARAVAKTLGLSEYFEFRQGDAFDLDLGVETLDLLWCDFGVGSRMKDFIASAWRSIRPGGFLLCHSTTTNENTRAWLEAVRSRQPIEFTGIPPDEYVELSLLEPHKRFQNSVSILQKRKNENGETFHEPIYSQYA